MKFSTILFLIALAIALLLIVAAINGATDPVMGGFLLIVAVASLLFALHARSEGN